MGLNRGQLKTNVRTNLDDEGLGTFYSEDDLNDSLQDAYDDIVVLTQCIPKTVTINWISSLSYYDFSNDCGINDYLATVAIFNNLTNRWLRDDLNLRDFDRLRRDWEIWEGTPQFWAPSDPKRIAIAPRYALSPGSFKLLYWAQAPVLATDSDILLTANDVQNLFEFYCTGDMLEQQQEFTKAAEYWEKYFNSIDEYAQRVKNNSKSDVLLRI